MHSPERPWYWPLVELFIPPPDPLLLICAIVVVTTIVTEAWKTVLSIDGGGGGGGVGVPITLKRRGFLLGGMILP